ncbi:MAG: hypothetical protein M1835_004546 [Candelina submexicana]|nr:MAG: hypothetical protein M1835_004546 [Candelina submexicana]
MRGPSEGGNTPEHIDGPIPQDVAGPFPVKGSSTASASKRTQISDREELMERIKRGESPTWVPSRALEQYFQSHDETPQELTSRPNKKRSSPLLPALELRECPKNPANVMEELQESAAEIERPKSALHAGDFTESTGLSQTPTEPTTTPLSQGSNINFASLPKTPWYASTQSPALETFQVEPAGLPITSKASEAYTSRFRATSLSSFSSSFVLKSPTSPLVQQSNSGDLDLPSTIDTFDVPANSSKSNRRHTLPPHAFDCADSPSTGQFLVQSSTTDRLTPLRRKGTFPYQAHQPQKSVTSTLGTPTLSTPNSSAFTRTRTPSLSSDISPLHHAPMVGSYEESILRGRMSTTPSKPLDFVAQIGVLGKGNCKPSLQCPAHVTVPFPAVFYSYGTGSGRKTSDDGPSPYVGLIDIENSLTPANEMHVNKRRRRHMTSTSDFDSPESLGSAERERRKRERRQRRSASPKAPPGGSYRIPQQGQLQIVIKNPNKTAVKLFLVPYDLQGMEAGTKTFVRQRSYSTGPVLEVPINANSGLQSGRLVAIASNAALDSQDRPTLRYLIHLHICCPSKGRFYLYKSIRVVFANRVPDGKEKLQNEIQLPEPKYASYKPSKDSMIGQSPSPSAAAERAFRRRSSGFALGPGIYDAVDGLVRPTNIPSTSISPYPQTESSPAPPIEPLPFSLARRTVPESAAAVNNEEDMDLDSPNRSRPTTSSDMQSSSASTLTRRYRKPICPTSPSTPGSFQTNSTDEHGLYEKLSIEDAGFGGHAFGSFNNGSVIGEGLLARKLKGLDVQQNLHKENQSQ